MSAEDARVFHVAADGPAITTGDDALGLIYDDPAQSADCIALPVTRLDPAFFDLRTGVAGELVQKFVNYGRRLAVVGDIGAYLGGALRDFVGEANRGRRVWFVADEAELDARLDGQPHSALWRPLACRGAARQDAKARLRRVASPD